MMGFVAGGKVEKEGKVLGLRRGVCVAVRKDLSFMTGSTAPRQISWHKCPLARQF